MKKLFLFICLLATTMLAKAVDFEYDGVTYTILSEADKTVSTKVGSSTGATTSHQGISGELNLHDVVEYNGEQYTLTTIGQYSFNQCSNLTGSLTIPESVTSIGAWAFRGCSGFTGSLTIPESVTSIGNEAFRNCSGFTGSLTVGETVTSIGNYAFYGCKGFTGSLTIPETVTSIGNYAFQYCSGFTGSLIIPESVTSIGNYAFDGCTGFTGSLTIGNAVISIGNSAFRSCSGFTGSLTIPDSVTSIGYSAFSNCSGFTAIELGESLEKIGESNGNTFAGCTKIESVTCHAVNPPLFYGSSNFDSSVLQNAYLFVPAESSGLYALAEVWKDFVSRDEITTPVETVAESLYLTIDGSLDLNPYFVTSMDDCVVVSTNTDVATVSTDNTVEAHQYGHTTVTYTLHGAPIATFDIYVCPTVTIEHGEGAVTTHFALHNTRPTIYLAAAHGYDIAGVTHDGDDVTDDVLAGEGYYTFAKPVTGDTVLNLAMVENPETGVDDTLTDSVADDIRLLVDGHYVTVIGLPEGENVGVFDLSGNMILESASPTFTIDAIGVFILRTESHVFKIIIR